MRRKKTKSQISNLILESSFALGEIDENQLKKYKDFIGLDISGVALSYLYTLAQRAQLAVLVSDAYPLPIFGMVHIDNELTLLNEIKMSCKIELKVHLSFEQEALTHKLYAIFNVDLFQEGERVSNCVSKYFASLGRQKSDKKKNKFELSLDGFTDFKEQAFDVSDAQKYAVVSGDFNFIHLHPLLGKLFGFKSSIIHGMCTSAMLMASLENSKKALTAKQRVSFKRPILLPDCVKFLSNENNELKVVSTDHKTLYLEASYNFTNE